VGIDKTHLRIRPRNLLEHPSLDRLLLINQRPVKRTLSFMEGKQVAPGTLELLVSRRRVVMKNNRYRTGSNNPLDRLAHGMIHVADRVIVSQYRLRIAGHEVTVRLDVVDTPVPCQQYVPVTPCLLKHLLGVPGASGIVTFFLVTYVNLHQAGQGRTAWPPDHLHDHAGILGKHIDEVTEVFGMGVTGEQDIRTRCAAVARAGETIFRRRAFHCLDLGACIRWKTPDKTITEIKRANNQRKQESRDKKESGKCLPWRKQPAKTEGLLDKAPGQVREQQAKRDAGTGHDNRQLARGISHQAEYRPVPEIK